MESYQIVLLSIIIGTVTIILFPILSRKLSLNSLITSSNNQPIFLILGVPNSGKTTFFNKLIQKADGDDQVGAITPTVMSQEENIGNLKLPLGNSHSSFQLIDFPGHIKFENLLINKLSNLKHVKGVLFMIDSSSNSESFENIANYLFKILKITERRTNGIDFCFACNKSELFNSKPASKIRIVLETEINKLIKTNLKNISTNNDKEQDDYEDDDSYWNLKEFKFEQLDGNMEFFDGSVLKNKTQIWENWFDEKAVNYN